MSGDGDNSDNICHHSHCCGRRVCPGLWCLLCLCFYCETVIMSLTHLHRFPRLLLILNSYYRCCCCSCSFFSYHFYYHDNEDDNYYCCCCTRAVFVVAVVVLFASVLCCFYCYSSRDGYNGDYVCLSPLPFPQLLPILILYYCCLYYDDVVVVDYFS